MQPEFRITWCLPDGTTLETDGFGVLNLLGHADTYDLEIPQKCGGQAECGTCRVRIESGEVTPCQGDERHLIERHASRFSDGERLSCRARPRSDCTVRVLALMPPDLRDFESD